MRSPRRIRCAVGDEVEVCSSRGPFRARPWRPSSASIDLKPGEQREQSLANLGQDCPVDEWRLVQNVHRRRPMRKLLTRSTETTWPQPEPPHGASVATESPTCLNLGLVGTGVTFTDFTRRNPCRNKRPRGGYSSGG